MVPGSSTEPRAAPAGRLDRTARRTLLQVARASIEHGLAHGRPLAVDPGRHPPPLAEPGAAFVTLHRGGRLRGCIGSLEAYRPLVVDVAENAYAAAFRDPRFPPLAPEELEDLAIEISVLGPPEPLPAAASEAEAAAMLRPGVDGVILELDGRRGTFLPAVWEQLPDPVLFLRHLKAKAGLPPDGWSPAIRLWRYTTESFGEDEA